MLVCEWNCTLCGWCGKTADLEDDDKGNKLCPRCHRIGGLE